MMRAFYLLADQRVHTQTLLNKTANIPEGNHLVMNEITKMRTSNAVVLNTRPDLAAPYCKSFRPALLSTGMASCSTHSSSSFPFFKLWTVETFLYFCSLVM